MAIIGQPGKSDDEINLDQMRETNEFAEFACSEWLAANEYLTSIGAPAFSLDQKIVPMAFRIRYAIELAKKGEFDE